jgi:hypothetical protein
MMIWASVHREEGILERLIFVQAFAEGGQDATITTLLMIPFLRTKCAYPKDVPAISPPLATEVAELPRTMAGGALLANPRAETPFIGGTPAASPHTLPLASLSPPLTPRCPCRFASNTSTRTIPLRVVRFLCCAT